MDEDRELQAAAVGSSSLATELSPQQHVRVLLTAPKSQRHEVLATLPHQDAWAATLCLLVERLDRLELLERQFDETLQREKLESMRELAYGASHEINNPLANISTRAQTLLRDETDPERRRKLATINSQAFRAHEMISNMMLFAKPPDLVRESVDLTRIVAQVVHELQTQANEQGTAIVTQGLDEACWLMADPNHLAVALQSLCCNSLEAVAIGGSLTITLRVAEHNAAREDGDSQAGEDEFVELSVEDSGPGISDAARQHLFDPFYSGREAGRGLGFGLSKCWRIVTLHGGSIHVSSREAAVTRFTMRLPRTPEPLASVALATDRQD